jgi:hypothetical protein
MTTRGSLRLAFVSGCIVAAGCLPQHRLNQSCTWTGDRPGELDLRSSVDRRHLEEDVRLAEELGIRHGDALALRTPMEQALDAREECTERLLAAVARRHGVDGEAVARASGARDAWIDFLSVYLPLAALLAVASDAVARRVARAFEPEEWRLQVAAFVVLTPVVAGFAVGLGDLWEWLVEIARLRNPHLSYRAFYLPLAQHPLVAWLSAMAIFAAVAILRLRRLRRRLDVPSTRRASRGAVGIGG